MDVESLSDFSVVSDISSTSSATNQSSPRRPRLRSPNLFRNFFSDSSSPGADQGAHLPPINYQETLRDVRSALQSADMAVRNAQEAFRNGRNNSSAQTVVDLTGSPPLNENDDIFMSQTTHPHDSARGVSAIRNATNPMHQPVYGHQHSPPVTRAQAERNSNTGQINFGAFNAAIARSFPGNLPFFLQSAPVSEVEVRRQEEAAVRRQRQARRDWQRLEAHRARQRDNEPQDRLQSPPPPPPLSPVQPSSSPTNHEIAPHSPIASPVSTFSMEPVDLTQVDDDTSLAAALARQRQDAVASQNTNLSNATGSSRSVFSGHKCAICMEPPTNATTTICGHLFCHKCIIDSLKWSEQLRRQELQRRNVKGLCPVCRTGLNARDTEGNGRGLVPLEIKTMSKSEYNESKQKFGLDVKGKGKAADAAVSLADISANLKQDDAENENDEMVTRKKRKREEDSVDRLFGEFIEDEI